MIKPIEADYALVTKEASTIADKKALATDLNKAYKARERERIDVKNFLLREYQSMLTEYTDDIGDKLKSRRLELLAEVKEEEQRQLEDYRNSFTDFSHNLAEEYGLDPMPSNRFTFKVSESESIVKSRIREYYEKQALSKVREDKVFNDFSVDFNLTFNDNSYKKFVRFCKTEGIKCIEL